MTQPTIKEAYNALWLKQTVNKGNKRMLDADTVEEREVVKNQFLTLLRKEVWEDRGEELENYVREYTFN